MAACRPSFPFGALEAMAQDKATPEKKTSNRLYRHHCASPLIMLTPARLLREQGLSVQPMKTGLA